MAIKKASHDGELRIGDLVIPCAIVDGKRLLSTRGVTKALGASKPSGAYYQRKKQLGESDAVGLPAFVAFPNIEPFIDKGLAMSLAHPERYFPKRGGGTPAIGTPAELLPAVCEVWLRARDAGAVPPRQQHIAAAAEILVRGLAHVGIIALVDEATGYQEIRDQEALQDLLDRFMRKEHAKWAKTFPPEFYENLFRLKGWQWRPIRVKKPQVVGHWTNDIIYDRLAPGVLKELQRLSEDFGHPALRAHLMNVIFLMRGNTQWKDFYRVLNRAAPKQGDMMLPFDGEPGEET
jgi:hypothetical protein